MEGATMIKEFKDFLFSGNIVELAALRASKTT